MTGLDTGGGSGTDWVGLIMASNEAALSWAQLFTGRRLPENDALIVTPDRVSVSNTSGIVLVLGLALVAYLVLSK